MQHVIGEDRNQFQIMCLEQLVPENSWARVIDLFVDLLPRNKLLIHSHIGGTTDKRELATVALEVQELLGKETFNTLSDAGYSTGDQLSLCKDSGICTYSSPMPSTTPYDNCLSIR